MDLIGPRGCLRRQGAAEPQSAVATSALSWPSGSIHILPYGGDHALVATGLTGQSRRLALRDGSD